jgi:hypothetical protein
MSTLATSYATIRAQLTEAIAGATWPSPEAGFLDYLQSTTRELWPLVTDRLQEAPILASAGYQYVREDFARPTEYDEEWARHFRRLATRQAFPIDRESYFFRPLELLGICLGAKTCPALTAPDRAWLRTTLAEGRAKLPEGSRSYALGAVAAAQLDVPWPLPPFHTKDLSLPTLSLFYWIAGQEPLAKPLGLQITQQSLAPEILARALTTVNRYDDLADAALIVYATQEVIERTIQSRIDETWHTPVNNADATRLVRHLCDRFAVIANTLQRRHANRATIQINDEYDVQDLLGALLKLHFDDVRPEEWTPSYAGNASRMDFLLKGEKVAVEAKMTRQGLGQKEIVTQLAEDILRYQAHQHCKTLICFVYNPTGKCSNPTALENDLTNAHGALNVVVLVRPKNR